MDRVDVANRDATVARPDAFSICVPTPRRRPPPVLCEVRAQSGRRHSRHARGSSRGLVFQKLLRVFTPGARGADEAGADHLPLGQHRAGQRPCGADQWDGRRNRRTWRPTTPSLTGSSASVPRPRNGDHCLPVNPCGARLDESATTTRWRTPRGGWPATRILRRLGATGKAAARDHARSSQPGTALCTSRMAAPGNSAASLPPT
jgi:hypothetical protein